MTEQIKMLTEIKKEILILLRNALEANNQIDITVCALVASEIGLEIVDLKKKLKKVKENLEKWEKSKKLKIEQNQNSNEFANQKEEKL